MRQQGPCLVPGKMWDCMTSKMSPIPACRAQRLRLIRDGHGILGIGGRPAANEKGTVGLSNCEYLRGDLTGAERRKP